MNYELRANKIKKLKSEPAKVSAFLILFPRQEKECPAASDKKILVFYIILAGQALLFCKKSNQKNFTYLLLR